MVGTMLKGPEDGSVQKIVRIFFEHNGNDFCIDRPFLSDKAEQENCDAAVSEFMDNISARKVVPCLLLIRKADVPLPKDVKQPTGTYVFLNLGQLDVIQIRNVIIAEVSAEPKDAQELP
jgi:hypothetical protein